MIKMDRNCLSLQHVNSQSIFVALIMPLSQKESQFELTNGCLCKD
jgi:hypothetical protein